MKTSVRGKHFITTLQYNVIDYELQLSTNQPKIHTINHWGLDVHTVDRHYSSMLQLHCHVLQRRQAERHWACAHSILIICTLGHKATQKALRTFTKCFCQENVARTARKYQIWTHELPAHYQLWQKTRYLCSPLPGDTDSDRWRWKICCQTSWSETGQQPSTRLHERKKYATWNWLQ